MIPKPKTPRSSRYLAWLRTLPCAWCGRGPPSDASHHGRRGVGIKASDLLAVPLCRACHRHHHGIRPAGSSPLPTSAKWPGARAWTGEEVREWAAGTAKGLRFVYQRTCFVVLL